MLGHPFIKSMVKQPLYVKRIMPGMRTHFPGSQAYRQATTVVWHTSVPQVPLQRWLLRRPQGKVTFTSTFGKDLFRSAMEQGHMEGFFRLLGNMTSSAQPTWSGSHTLAMALNALDIDPGRIWKGNWRWFSGDQLQTCSSREAIESRRGILFDEFACMAQAYCHVQARRAAMADYETFLLDLDHATSDPNIQLVVHHVNDQHGCAKYSPVGGHNRIEGMTLLMDSSSSTWIDTRDLYEKMLAEEDAGLSRGYFILTPGTPGASQTITKCTQCSSH